MSFEHTTQQPPKPDASTQHSSAPPPTATTAPMASASQAVHLDPTDAATIPPTSSAPELTSVRILSANSVPFSPSLDVSLLQPSRSSPGEAGGLVNVGGNGGAMSPVDSDAQIIEALRSKDRLWVLKTGEMMEALITERKQPRLDLNPTTSYQRMLVHRCAAYYKLAPETDSTSKTIFIYHRAESRIPARRMSELVPAEESAQPAFQIMRRNVQDRRMRQNSEPGSATGDDADVSDAEPSEAGSVSARSNATGTSKRHLTIEEREAAYNEARSRIFMGFDGKEKEKDNGSTNSSSISVNSTSVGRNSLGEGEGSISSAATESEFSAPVTRDKPRRGASAGSSRSLRSGTYKQASGSNSSRHSRAASPSFAYPTLYDPAGNACDPYYPQAPPSGYPPYYYPYPSAGYPPPPPPPSANLGYGYGYPQYGFTQHPHHHSDPVTPSEHMYPQPSNTAYPPSAYQWTTPGQPPHQLPPVTSPANGSSTLPAPPPQPQTSPGVMPTQHAGQMGYPGYFSPPYAPPYGYYPPQFQPTGHPMPTPPPMQGQYYSEPPHGADFPSGGHDFGHNGADHSRASSRNSNGHGRMNGHGRGGARRQPWSYGPGIGMNPGNGDIVGPRLSSRRTSSGSTQSAGYRTPGDEASSVASSSTTSSSSQRTFTSTSSKHPLPARPDWAVGLKAQPTLSRAHHGSDPNSRTMSPARMGGNLPHQRTHQQPPQPTDFPPLSSAPEKKTPIVGGAWTNPSNVRSALRVGSSSTPNAPSPGSALVHYPSQASNAASNAVTNQNANRFEDQDRAFERPQLKGNGELFDPRACKPQPLDGGASAELGDGRRDEDTLAERVGILSLGTNGDVSGLLTASPTSTPATVDA